MSSLAATFLASVKSVGTACTMAMVGVYLHQRGFVDSTGKRTLALISQQVAFPLFLFTKLIYCEQDWSPEPCPDVTGTLRQGWILLIWPLFVVTAGLAIGRVVARLTRTPMSQRKSVWAAIAFGNSTGLPITLLAVVHKKFAATSVFGSIDPALFLSVYLLLYPALQWGMGGWLLAPDDKVKEDSEETENDPALVSQTGLTDVEGGHDRRYYDSVRESFSKNVLNFPESVRFFDNHKLSSNDEGIYQSETNMAQTYQDVVSVDSSYTSLASVAEASVGLDLAQEEENEGKPLLPMGQHLQSSYQSAQEQEPAKAKKVDPRIDADVRQQGNFIQTLKNVSDRCFQPPVISALLGMLVAMVPQIRGIFVDIIDRRSHAPLEWIFDGLYEVGKAAVPINMLILGCNLSNSYNQYLGKNEKSTQAGLFSKQTMIGILLGKMIVMPLVGISSALLLRLFVLDIPEDMATSFYLVLMIVFLTVSGKIVPRPSSVCRTWGVV